MNNQDLFDKVVTHLAQQGERSVEHEGCLYRGPGGTSCAIGCLIPDSEYDPSFEGESVLSLRSQLASLQGLDESLLEELQDAHDNAESPQRLKTLLTLVASDFELDPGVTGKITEWS